ncbi:MAG TPA: class I SAM-dependent methyltransferase [Vicinamibacterales bacterium]|nr:class I SAM-dependent methyltransferase [Vicinamibacterales bacterium]
MRSCHAVRNGIAVVLALTIGGASAAAQGQAAPKPYEPTVGQAGKDVVWVPTPQSLVDKMLDMAKVTPQDFLMDLGSGDGRTVITAAKRGARAMGVEYNPDMVALSLKNAEAAGVNGKASFVKADLFETDFSKATVITMFLLPDINLKLRPKILDLKPGTRVVSNSFTMGEWEADESETVEDGCTSWCTAHLWIVPAKVEGDWQLPEGTLTLDQEFQMVSGTLGSTAISGGRLRGEEISFSAGNVKYVGRVNGDTIQGTVTGGPGGTWTARKRG